MEIENAVTALSALAQETRLAVFRLLVREQPDGLPAGEVAARLGVAPATLSFHLAHLERAGLLSSSRRSRQIVYRVDLEGTRELLAFLTEDCCQGRPDLCGALKAEGSGGPHTASGAAGVLSLPSRDKRGGRGAAPEPSSSPEAT